MSARKSRHPAPRLAGLLALACAGAVAQDQPQPATPPPPLAWEGAIGLIGSYRPEYQGADKARLKITPALFLRYGRLTITNASGFVTRRADDVARGLALDLVQSDRVRLNASLRVDAGRREAISSELAGMGDIRPTVRVRFNSSYRLDAQWRVGLAWSFDALGRGGGNAGDLGVVWEQRLWPHTNLSLGASLSAAGDRFMQTYYGVTEAQAARSGYPVYTPAAGLRDVSVVANLRHDIGADWIVLAGAGSSRLVGPAAASPLTHSRSGWGINAGFARRF